MAERNPGAAHANSHRERPGENGRSYRALPYPSGRLLFVLRAIPVLLLAFTVALGAWTIIEVRETVRDEFNQQQLALARQVAARIDATLQTLRLELSSVEASLEESDDVPAALPSLFLSTQRRASVNGLVEIRYVGVSSERTAVLKQDSTLASEPLDNTDRFLLRQPGLMKASASQPYIQDAPYAPRARPLMTLATSVSTKTGERGVLYFLVDDRELAAKAVAGIQSGRTGYAWIINADGIFLAHPVKEFVGQDAFEARESKQPMISFDRINEIQKTRMLTGQEGTSWYISGSRDDQEDNRPVEKLIAFAPIQIGGVGGYRSWSVAVVAPASEVESTVNSLWLKLIGALSPAVIAVALVLVLVVMSQRQQAYDLQQAVDAAVLNRARSEARYRTLVESADDLIYTLSYDGQLLSANRAALRLFAPNLNRHERDGVVGKPLADFIGAAAAADLLREVRETIDHERGMSHEHSLVVGDREYWLNTKLRLLEEPNPGGRIVLAISRDITGKHTLDEQIYNTEKLASLGTLAAGVAHEINNPLASILGFADLLLEKFPPQSQEHADLQIIEDRAEHCRQIVENLLDFARVGASVGESTNPNDDVESVLHLVANTLLTNKITLERNLDPAVPSIRGNSKELQQVLLNLINNAIYAMKKGGGKLSVASALRGNRVLLKIADTGTGIPGEVQRKIFDPFFTTKGVGEGTGLGLSVSLGLVQKLGGTITFTSSTGNARAGEPAGSVFTIILPVPTTEGASQ
ncbi:MAG: ATP-binding protein [Chloroflexi bacterium]|nr:ATP-binding protein [Chloroflexota bacterium]